MKNSNGKWILVIFILAFTLSIIFSSISTLISTKLNTVFLIITTIVVIGIGIIFDMIGVSVLTCKEPNLHAKAAKKIKGAKEAIQLVKNAPKVSSICCDVIGDICGIVSGTLGAVVTLSICNYFDLSQSITTVIVTAVISSLTVGFKAVFKTVATKHADTIILITGKIKSIFTLKKGK